LRGLRDCQDSPRPLNSSVRRKVITKERNAMSFIKHIKEERYKIIVTLITGFISFLIALLINTAINNWNESKTHDSMLKAIKTEAESNRAILNGSFKKYYKDGIVLNEFSTGTVRQHLANPLFVKHAK